jgi:D-xylulose reductase
MPANPAATMSVVSHQSCHNLNIPVLQLCPDIIFAATPPYDGTLGRFYRVPADLAYPLPAGVSLEDGAMVSVSLDNPSATC